MMMTMMVVVVMMMVVDILLEWDLLGLNQQEACPFNIKL